MSNNEPLLKEKNEDLIIIDGEEMTLPEVSEKTEVYTDGLVNTDPIEKKEVTISEPDDDTALVSVVNVDEENKTEEAKTSEETEVVETPEEKKEELSLETVKVEEKPVVEQETEEEKEEVVTAIVKKEDASKSKKSNKKELITTIVFAVIVFLLLYKTIVNFYYGFKYKDYVPENEVTETNK